MSYCKLTICFESPYWIGIVESEDDSCYQAAKHIFGAEPTDPEIGEFIRDHWNELSFTSDFQVEKTEGRKINHKRMQRLISKEIAAHSSRGTKAQQALSKQREENKQASRRQSKVEREAEKQERFTQRTGKAQTKTQRTLTVQNHSHRKTLQHRWPTLA